MSAAAHALPRRELVLDRYRPLRPLGSGGSGSVWLARDEQTGLDVALKIVPREGKAADRAEREAEAASRLRHERCLRAYGFGSDSGHVYIAYEYVSGRTLRDAMRGGELRDGQAIEAAAQILDGLAHAHSRGIVHRDVKPSNVLLADDDGVPERQISVRLLDFGLAQFDEAETLTAVGDVPGTLAYISPERLCGEEACPASDVWGVGVLLWEALAGKHPFWGVPLSQMAGTIESGAPPLQLERPDLPKRLLAAVGHALARDPARRPSAAALAKELRAALAGPRRSTKVESVYQTQSLLRLAPAAATGVAAGVGAAMLPFYPSGAAAGIAVVAAVASLRAPRAGLALALAAPVFPLGNVALGLALAYGAVALAWLALSWRDARFGLAFLAGPLLAPLGLLGLVPVAVAGSRGAVRRAAQALAAVAVATVTAGVRGWDLPFRQGAVPPLDLKGTDSAVTAATALVEAVPAGLALEALALAAIAVAIPSARTPWRIAGLGAGALAATLLAVPTAPALPFVAAVWLTCAGL
ncbi:MAG TPA: serine/threonine-protein kinase, partial [Gaiellaceae bacterium]|nr:serine/threonine-protein kinase [Gaiellaceae bacterium]